MDPLSLLVLAGSMLTKYMANSDASGRQMQMQRSMEAYQRSKAQQNEQAINSLMQQQTPDARKTELDNIEKSRETSMQGTVDAARAASPVTNVAGTNTSDDYQRASAASADTIANRTKRAIQQLGLMGAPGEQAITSGIRFGRAAGNVDANNSAISNVGNAYMTDIKNVHPDPFLSLIGDAGMGVGSGMLGASLGSPAGTPSQPSPDVGDPEWGMRSPTATTRQSKLRSLLSGWGG